MRLDAHEQVKALGEWIQRRPVAHRPLRPVAADAPAGRDPEILVFAVITRPPGHWQLVEGADAQHVGGDLELDLETGPVRGDRVRGELDPVTRRRHRADNQHPLRTIV